ncbi:NYN domain-containing protein [Thiocystis violacea]|uniref:NYN domain-containing protein n=1 Tax=Thiocystis violacea TaxID=13725 RepID=UPI0019073CB6|nr:NYN domain-containing protein [Thiocystis violacea]MBK1724088.1 hypothetical protein [Thiocystis violacea]
MENAIPLHAASLLDEGPLDVPAAQSLEHLVRVALYVDADNQSSQSAGALIDLLHKGLGARLASATIAGNANGRVCAGWADALREQIPDLPIKSLVVPCRKDAADAALILALGADLAEHLRADTRVVLVSRDALLHAAAAQVKSAGCQVFIAYADCERPTARHPTLTTLLLPALSTSAATPERLPVAAVAPRAALSKGASEPVLDVANLVAQVRSLCKQRPGGGYSPTDVGQALSNLGYKTPKDRKRVIATFPGLREQGTHPNKVLLF